MTYKEEAVKAYEEKVRKDIPWMKDVEIEGLLIAFSTGFDMGNANHSPEIVQDMALKMLSGEFSL